MNKHINNFIIISLLIFFLCSCAACSQAGDISDTFYFTLTDGLGREVTLASAAKRIVSLAPPNTEMLFALGAGSQVVGRDTFSDFPAEAKDISDVGGSFGEYDLETILSLQPDLVLAGGINTPELVQSLEDLGVKVFYLSNPSDLGGMYAMLETIGRLSGHDAKASEVIEALKDRVDQVTNQLAGITSRPTVFYELDATDPAKPFTPGANTFYTSLIQLAGGENIASELEAEWAQISLEQLLTWDPEVILLGDAMWGETPEKVAAREGWGVLTAVKNGRVFAFDDNLMVRIGPRQVDGLEALAKLLHPEAFQ
jgi:iron complex transport system substrate-binding protein